MISLDDVPVSQSIFGLIGCPVQQSMSPSLFRFVFNHQRINAVYSAWDVKPDELKESLQMIRASRIEGVNVTIPHKTSVIKYLDGIDGIAANIGAVNCIAKKKDQFIGYNTDCIGMVQTLLPYQSVIDQSTIAVLGAGGAARAAIYALLTVFNPRRILICNRSFDNAENIIRDFKRFLHSIPVKYIHPDDIKNDQFDPVINCIPHNHLMNIISYHKKPFSKIKYFFDLNYRSDKKDIMDCSGNPDITYIDGRTLLVHQAAESYKIWTGQTMPVCQALEYLNRRL